MSNDPNALQKAEAANLMVAQHTKVMRDAAVRVKDAIKPFTDEDRKRVIDIALEELGCKLAVRGPGPIIARNSRTPSGLRRLSKRHVNFCGSI